MAAHSKMQMDWIQLTDSFWTQLSDRLGRRELYEQVMEAMLEIETSEHPEHYENVAKLFSLWLAQEASEISGHDAWVCSYSYNNKAKTRWIQDDDVSTMCPDDEPDEMPEVQCGDGTTIVKPWVMRKKRT